jgi:hypothetical protein
VATARGGSGGFTSTAKRSFMWSNSPVWIRMLRTMLSAAGTRSQPHAGGAVRIDIASQNDTPTMKSIMPSSSIPRELAWRVRRASMPSQQSRMLAKNIRNAASSHRCEPAGAARATTAASTPSAPPARVNWFGVGRHGARSHGSSSRYASGRWK